MAYNYEYPGVNMNDYNNDWLINKVKELASEWKKVQQDWTTQQEAFESLKAYIENYFKNLDIYEEVSEKIDELYNSGELLQIMKPTIELATSAWLKQNITTGSFPIDKSLTIEGAGADAKTVGDKAFLNRGQDVSQSRLAGYRKMGTYYIPNLNSLEDAPPGLSNNVQLKNTGIFGGLIVQEVYDRLHVKSPFWRIINNEGVVTLPWSSNNLPFFTVNGTASDKLSNYLTVGIYDIVNIQNFPDSPIAGRSQMLVIGTYGGASVQLLYNSDVVNKPYVRRVYSPDNASDWIRINQDSPLYNKKVLCIGDSFMEGGNLKKTIPYGKYAGKKASYIYLIGNETECNIIDMAVGGRRIGGDNGFANTQIENIPVDSDYVIIALGINDDGNHQKTPLGVITDNTIDTFYGAWNILMNAIYTKSPGAHIGIIATNGIDNANISYSQAIVEIAKKWCVPCLNLAYGDDTPTLNRSAKSLSDYSPIALEARNLEFRTSSSDTHPNEKAHEYESVFIKEWMLTL